MRVLKYKASFQIASVILLSTAVCSSASAQIYKLPVPTECSSTKTLKVPRANHPEKYTAYGKVDIYCGSSSKAITKGATLCNSDFDSNNPLQKTVTIAVSMKTTSGKVASCKAGEDPKFVSE